MTLEAIIQLDAEAVSDGDDIDEDEHCVICHEGGSCWFWLQMSEREREGHCCCLRRKNEKK